MMISQKNTWTEKLKREAHGDSLIFRRALRSAIIAGISILIYQYFSLQQGYWVTLTAVIVVQATVGATLRKGFQRFLGTLLGVSIASILLLLIHNSYLLDILMILFLFLTYFFNPFTNLINYGLVVVPLSISVVFLMAMTNPEKISAEIIQARFYDTAIGAVLGIAGALFLFPNKVRQEFNSSKKYLEKQRADYFWAIINMFLNIPGAEEQAKAKKLLIEETLLSERQFYIEQIYEIHFHLSAHEIERRLIEASEKTVQRLFSLHHIARSAQGTDIFNLLYDILSALRDEGAAFLNHYSDERPVKNTLNILQKRLIAMAKKRDNLQESHWQDIACLASLHFSIAGLIEDLASRKI